ncbi:hypothetical protein [Neopusillimonas maritima]|nr:hypothetical protein [Neopusillimonas maritima]|tara:strand:- start:355 stop:1194 length:840 start_codon:yes stop_codon:yes gene_type:complete
MPFDSECVVNSVVWIATLPEKELGPTNRMVEDVEQFAHQSSFSFCYFVIKNRADLTALLTQICSWAAEKQCRPIIVLDGHGSRQDGLKLSDSGETITWAELSEHLQWINVETGNNLCVIGAACYSLQAISLIKLNAPTPYFVLLAPEQEVNVGFLEKNLPAFFKLLFTTNSLKDAYCHYLSSTFTYFHCEKLFFRTMAIYIQNQCKGKAAAQRRERLMTEFFMDGLPNNPNTRKLVRDKIKKGLKPTQDILDGYAKIFLINRKCSFTMDELFDYLDNFK